MTATAPWEAAWEEVAWREGTKGPLVKQFARLRDFRTSASPW